MIIAVISLALWSIALFKGDFLIDLHVKDVYLIFEYHLLPVLMTILLLAIGLFHFSKRLKR